MLVASIKEATQVLNPTIHFTQATSLQRGTAGRLINWLEWTINALVPDNGIDYWYVPRYRPADQRGYLVADDDLPEYVSQIACYAANGANEGRYVCVALKPRGEGLLQVGFAKSFGSADECWHIARLCSEALACVFRFGREPVLREMFMRLPRAQSWHRETTVEGVVQMRCRGADALEVATAQGLVLDTRQFSGRDAAAQRQAYIADWTTVLGAQGLSVEIVQEGTHACSA